MLILLPNSYVPFGCQNCLMKIHMLSRKKWFGKIFECILNLKFPSKKSARYLLWNYILVRWLCVCHGMLVRTLWHPWGWMGWLMQCLNQNWLHYTNMCYFGYKKCDHFPQSPVTWRALAKQAESDSWWKREKLVYCMSSAIMLMELPACETSA